MTKSANPDLDAQLTKIIIKDLFGGKIPLDTEEDRELAYRIPAYKQALTALIAQREQAAADKRELSVLMDISNSPEYYEDLSDNVIHMPTGKIASRIAALLATKPEKENSNE